MNTALKDAPWNFSVYLYQAIHTKKAWVRQWVALQEEEQDEIPSYRIITDPFNEEKWKDLIAQFEESPQDRLFYRVAEDYEAQYGDGGYQYLIFPIWKCDNLPVSEATRLELALGLHKLSQTRKDYQKNSPVEDIIDPDLAPYVIPTEYVQPWVEWRTHQLKKLSDIGSSSRALSTRIFHLKRSPPKADQISENVKLRSTYQWIPTEISVDLQGKVTFLSSIHNLPPTLANKTLYRAIGKVFQAMVPMFAKLNLIKKDQETTLQVIIKAQSYNLLPGMSYAGRWHMEGQTENIVAAGVYYPHVSSELKGGNLKFRPIEAPQPSYEICTDYEVIIEEGTAVVFSNTIPHRFKKIVNTSSKPQRRTLINFFIVDPSQPIKSTKALPSTEFVIRALKYYVKKYLHQILPNEIASYIVSCIPGMWVSTSASKSFRQKARQAMVEDKSGWGWINWGNCGDTQFHPSITTCDGYERPDELHHTDSDNPTNEYLCLCSNSNF